MRRRGWQTLLHLVRKAAYRASAPSSTGTRPLRDKGRRGEAMRMREGWRASLWRSGIPKKKLGSSSCVRHSAHPMTGIAVSVKSTRKGVSACNRRRNAGHGYELTRSVELPVLRGPLLAREHDHARLDRRPSRLGRGKSGSIFGAALDLAKCGSSSLVERRRQVARLVLLRQHLVLVGIDCREERCGVRVARKERQCRGLGVATHQTHS